VRDREASLALFFYCAERPPRTAQLTFRSEMTSRDFLTHISFLKSPDL
jgi:hypothetical protein